LSLVVSTSAIDCLERLDSEMTCYVSSGMLNPTHSLTHSWVILVTGLCWQLTALVLTTIQCNQDTRCSGCRRTSIVKLKDWQRTGRCGEWGHTHLLNRRWHLKKEKKEGTQTSKEDHTKPMS